MGDASALRHSPAPGDGFLWFIPHYLGASATRHQPIRARSSPAQTTDARSEKEAAASIEWASARLGCSCAGLEAFAAGGGQRLTAKVGAGGDFQFGFGGGGGVGVEDDFDAALVFASENFV